MGATWARRAAVKIPMTPKGVEHSEGVAFLDTVDIVKIPMTPKGVEHSYSMPGMCGQS